MFFQEDYNAPPEEESPPAGGARLFFWLLGGEAAGLLKLNLVFLLACLPVVTIPPAYHALHRLARRMVQGVLKSGSPTPKEITSFISAAKSKKRRIPEGLISWTVRLMIFS